jgi:hypothetical protein
MFPLVLAAPALGKLAPVLAAIGAGVAVAMLREREVIIEIEKESPDGERWWMRAEYRQRSERRRGPSGDVASASPTRPSWLA